MTVPENLLLTTDTPFDHYQVIERQYEGRLSRVLFSGQRRAAQSGIPLDDNPDLLFDYNQRALEMLNAVYPKRILMIGGGAFTLPMAAHAALPDAHITVVELDPELQQIAEQYFGLQVSDRLELVFGDGREFLQTTDQRYDFIFVDVFSELQIPKQFLTYEFITLLRKRLRKGGVVSMNIIASYKGMNDGLIKSQIAAYGHLFDQLDIYPAAYGLTSWLPQNLLLFAQTDPTNDYSAYIRYAPIEIPKADKTDMILDATLER